MSAETKQLWKPKLLSEWELWARAHETIRQRQLDAPIFAAMRADELMEAADLDGAHNWRLIVHRINQLLEPEGRGGH
ncbi:MAG: hypothetical protein M3448_07410 [Pseudomonadota bacterium]|nr:hypothetical protein [Pseudomonadota bacterium]